LSTIYCQRPRQLGADLTMVKCAPGQVFAAAVSGSGARLAARAIMYMACREG